MDEDQLAIFRFNFASPRRAGWTTAPMVRADWRDLDVEESLVILRSIDQWFEDDDDVPSLLQAHAIERVRVADLICYPDAMLVECQGYTSDGFPGVFSVLIYTDGMLHLSGSSMGIHGLNVEMKPDLSTEAKQLAYLEFFMNWVHGDDGRFQPVTSEDDIIFRCQPGTVLDLNMEIHPPKPCEYLPEPVVPEDDKVDADTPEQDEPSPTFKAIVLYGTNLFEAVMVIRPTGMVEMKSDDNLAEDLPVIPEVMEGVLLVQRASE